MNLLIDIRERIKILHRSKQQVKYNNISTHNLILLLTEKYIFVLLGRYFMDLHCNNRFYAEIFYTYYTYYSKSNANGSAVRVSENQNSFQVTVSE